MSGQNLSTTINEKCIDSIGSLAHDKRFINVGDTSHRDIMSHSVVAGSIPRLASIGIKHIFLESYRENQPKLDKLLQDDPVDRFKVFEYFFEEGVSIFAKSEDRARHAGASSELVMRAKEYGIKIHFADSREGDDYLKSKYPIISDNIYDIKRIYAEEGGDALKEFLKDKEGVELNRIAEYLEEELRIRDNMNKELAEFIKKKSQDIEGNPEKAVIIFGYGHSADVLDLDEFIGVKDTHTVAIYPSISDKESSLDKSKQRKHEEKDHYSIYFGYSCKDIEFLKGKMDDISEIEAGNITPSTNIKDDSKKDSGISR